MLWTQFVAYFDAHKGRISKVIAAQIRREAIARVQERWKEGYVATEPLYFDDLIARIEKAVQPR